jgi:hypothetical protein
VILPVPDELGEDRLNDAIMHIGSRANALAGATTIMPIFDFIALNSDFRIDDEEPLRLRDLIVGLRSGAIPASFILDRLDTDLSDEIRAVVAHRGVPAESFLAKALVNFALDAADEAWRQLESRAAPAAGDAEAGAFASLLSEALRRALLRNVRIGSQHPSSIATATLGRRVGASQ